VRERCRGAPSPCSDGCPAGVKYAGKGEIIAHSMPCVGGRWPASGQSRRGMDLAHYTDRGATTPSLAAVASLAARRRDDRDT